MNKFNEDAFAKLQELSRLKISKWGAAKILYKNKKFGFTSLDAARSFVRWHTGSQGRKSKEHIVWMTDYPDQVESGFGFFDIPDAVKGVGLITDIHLPFHDIDTIDAFLAREDYEVMIIQEVFDFHGLSRFDKFRTIKISEEQESFWQLMEHIRIKKPKIKIYFQRGNHDERFQKFIMGKAKEFEDLQGMEFETIFGFDQFKIEMIPLRNIIRYRGLHIGHGHEIAAGGAPVNPARTFYLKTKGNFIGGHFHRTSSHIENNIEDKIMGCWSTGCACDTRPMYAPVNNWNHGFAIIHQRGQKYFDVENVMIFK